jgi:hypothetical protein
VFENYPTVSLDGFDLIDPLRFPEEAEFAVSALQRVISRGANNACVLKSACNRLAMIDVGTAKEAAEQLVSLSPTDVDAYEILTHAALKQAYRTNQKKVSDAHATCAMNAAARAVLLADNPDRRLNNWAQAAMANFARGDLQSASVRARILIACGNRNNFEADYLAYTVLGLVALANDNLADARGCCVSAATILATNRIPHTSVELSLVEALEVRGEQQFVYRILRMLVLGTDDRSVRRLLTEAEDGVALSFPERGLRFP